MVIAHAGGEGLGPANTILAMQRSIAAGADVLDVDLRMTSDGVIVARHDRDVSTSTDGHGNIDELTWDQVRRLDTRPSWTGAPIADPVPVPSLEEILAAFPTRRISVEIKQTGRPMGPALCDELTRLHAVDRVYVGSVVDADALATKEACPSVVITTTDADFATMSASRADGSAWCDPAPIAQPAFAEDLLTTDRIRWTHDHGAALYTWTVDDAETLRRLAKAGIDGVFTRRPDIARKVFDEVTANSS